MYVVTFDYFSEGLCTFTKTGAKYHEQHWYRCLTCTFVEGEGVCSNCVETCHADHDVSYAKYSEFFCDCGAKGEESCNSLTKNQAGKNTQYLVADLTKKSCSGSKLKQ